MYSEGSGETSPDSPKADSGGEAGGRLGHHLAQVDVWGWRQGGQQRGGLTRSMRSFSVSPGSSCGCVEAGLWLI